MRSAGRVIVRNVHTTIEMPHHSSFAMLSCKVMTKAIDSTAVTTTMVGTAEAIQAAFLAEYSVDVRPRRKLTKTVDAATLRRGVFFFLP